METRYLFLLLISLVLVSSQRETITRCEEEGQYIADVKSCTTFHRCRILSDQIGDRTSFTTDVAICQLGTVFDLVTKQCVDIGEGLLQDPASCVKYYGCEISRDTSEGYVRSSYHCPGDLRFHPGFKRCIYKTRVEDDLCNSLNPTQMVIRTDIGAPEDFNALESLIRPFRTGPDVLQQSQSILGVVRGNAVVQDQRPASNRSPDGNAQNLLRPVQVRAQNKDTKKVSLPEQTDSIDRIAQVISGQLFNLQRSNNGDKNKGKKIEKVEEKKKEEKLSKPSSST